MGDESVYSERERNKSTIVVAHAYRLIPGSMRWRTDDERRGLTIGVFLEIRELFWRQFRLRLAHVVGVEEEMEGLEVVRGSAAGQGANMDVRHGVYMNENEFLT